jgi:hypothetical protein
MLTSTPDIAVRTPLPCHVTFDDDLKKKPETPTRRGRFLLQGAGQTDKHTDELMVGLTSTRGGGIKFHISLTC